MPGFLKFKLNFSYGLTGIPEATTALATTPMVSGSGKRLAQTCSAARGSGVDWTPLCCHFVLGPGFLCVALVELPL